MPSDIPGPSPLSQENQALIARHFPGGVPPAAARELARQAVDQWFLGGKRSPQGTAVLARDPELFKQWTRRGLDGVFKAAPRVLGGASRQLGGPGGPPRH